MSSNNFSWTNKIAKTIYKPDRSGDNIMNTNEKKKKIVMKAEDSTGLLFSVYLIGAIMHSKATKSILDKYSKGRKRSSFIQKAIIDFACDKGFAPLESGANKPSYISRELWKQIIMAQQKSYHVDYTYVAAFFWLLSQPEFEVYTKSALMREIIIERVI